MAHSQKVVIRHITAAHVAALWGWIQPDVEAMLKKHPDDYYPHHVLASLLRPGDPGGAACFLVLLDGEYAGFAVVEFATEPFQGKRTLFIWLLHFRGAEEVEDGIYEWMERVKVLSNCSRIHMKSPRLGWLKKTKEKWKLKMLTWEKHE